MFYNTYITLSSITLFVSTVTLYNVKLKLHYVILCYTLPDKARLHQPGLRPPGLVLLRQLQPLPRSLLSLHRPMLPPQAPQSLLSALSLPCVRLFCLFSPIIPCLLVLLLFCCVLVDLLFCQCYVSVHGIIIVTDRPVGAMGDSIVLSNTSRGLEARDCLSVGACHGAILCTQNCNCNWKNVGW